MIDTLLSLLGGGALRVVPEILGLMNKKADNAHELLMMEAQLKLEGFKQAGQQAAAMMQGDVDKALALLDANKEALAGQMQRVGIWWVDALNMLVRPLTTYWFLFLYSLVKFATVIVALRASDPWTAIILCWTKDDAAILSGILAFWFVGRVFDKRGQ